MIELISFIQKYLPIEAFLPLFFVILIIFIKYVYSPWDKKINLIHDLLISADNMNHEKLDKIKKILSEIETNMQEHKDYCDKSCMNHSLDLKKIMEKLEMIEKNVSDIVNRLEKVKDDAKDGKIDLNQQLFSIKQEISDLKSKIEPLLFISRGIK